MTKKIGILIGIIVMLGCLSGLNAIQVHIHNVWLYTNDDLMIHCAGFPPGWQTLTIATADGITQGGYSTIVYSASVLTPTECTISQGNRSITFTLPDESSGITDIDVTLPGGWQLLPDPIEKK